MSKASDRIDMDILSSILTKIASHNIQEPYYSAIKAILIKAVKGEPL